MCIHENNAKDDFASKENLRFRVLQTESSTDYYEILHNIDYVHELI